jgi:hypothetical protein
VDEHDFYCGRYLDDNVKPIEIEIHALLTALSAAAEKRFFAHHLSNLTDLNLRTTSYTELFAAFSQNAPAFRLLRVSAARN